MENMAIDLTKITKGKSGVMFATCDGIIIYFRIDSIVNIDPDTSYIEIEDGYIIDLKLIPLQVGNQIVPQGMPLISLLQDISFNYNAIGYVPEDSIITKSIRQQTSGIVS